MNFRDYTEIIFEAGNLLSAEMLEETYRYPRDFLHLNYASFGDGIITGLDFVPTDDGLLLTSGIVKLRGQYFILPQDLNLDKWLKNISKTLTETVFYCLFLECNEVTNFDDKERGIARRSQLLLKIERDERDKPKDSLLLAKYKHRGDSKLVLPKIKLNDAKNPFSEFFQLGLLQILENEYSHPQGGTTYHPLLFRAIGKFLEQKSLLSPYDFNLLLEIQNRGLVSISSLKAYITATKKTSPPKDLNREELFKAVVDCVQTPYKLTRVSIEDSKQNPTTRETKSAWIED